MSSLRNLSHTPNCTTVDLGGGLTGYLCSSSCPAMAAFLVQPGQTTGECDHQPWDQMSQTQIDTLIDAVAAKAKIP